MKLPYYPMKNNEVREAVLRGHRLSVPSEESYVDNLMHSCLQHYPEDRPSFLLLNQRIAKVISELKGSNTPTYEVDTCQVHSIDTYTANYEEIMEKDYENLGQSGYENVTKK
eukprot:TRINITY_DN2762_c0_g1_i1.p1 TRINITY_DN2762_c0_g1~~TRINITY_DN2762_c0_g1_i1.p1  ORF type:complete len:112 (-),score=25.54 TRINITY_DN2762_c0_g1_i1:179-514(-)